MPDNLEGPKFPKEVQQGRLITAYNKDSNWTTSYNNGEIADAVDDIGHWFDSSHGFKRERVLDQLRTVNPSFSVTFSSNNSPKKHKNILDWRGELDMRKVLAFGFAVGFKATYSKSAGENYEYIVIPANAIGFFGSNAQEPGVNTLKTLESYYVTETQIHPFYLYDKDSPERVVGQDSNRVLVKVDCLTAEQFLAQYQQQRRTNWTSQRTTLTAQINVLLAQKDALESKLALYDLTQLPEMEQYEQGLLPRTKVLDPVRA